MWLNFAESTWKNVIGKGDKHKVKLVRVRIGIPHFQQRSRLGSATVSIAHLAYRILAQSAYC
jgi:hypothetical protein